MKILFVLISFCTWAHATPKWDSVAVFHRPERVLIQINEAGREGRLQKLMNVLKADDRLLLMSIDQSFRLDCARNASAVNCALRMLPSPGVQIEARSVRVNYPASELGLADATEFPEISFLNSNGDHLRLQIGDGKFALDAGKK